MDLAHSIKVKCSCWLYSIHNIGVLFLFNFVHKICISTIIVVIEYISMSEYRQMNMCMSNLFNDIRELNKYVYVVNDMICWSAYSLFHWLELVRRTSSINVSLSITEMKRLDSVVTLRAMPTPFSFSSQARIKHPDLPCTFIQSWVAQGTRSPRWWLICWCFFWFFCVCAAAVAILFFLCSQNSITYPQNRLVLRWYGHRLCISYHYRILWDLANKWL